LGRVDHTGSCLHRAGNWRSPNSGCRQVILVAPRDIADVDIFTIIWQMASTNWAVIVIAVPQRQLPLPLRVLSIVAFNATAAAMGATVAAMGGTAATTGVTTTGVAMMEVALVGAATMGAAVGISAAGVGSVVNRDPRPRRRGGMFK
jgi:hypothetical protein